MSRILPKSFVFYSVCPTPALLTSTRPRMTLSNTFCSVFCTQIRRLIPLVSQADRDLAGTGSNVLPLPPVKAVLLPGAVAADNQAWKPVCLHGSGPSPAFSYRGFYRLSVSAGVGGRVSSKSPDVFCGLRAVQLCELNESVLLI